MGCRVKGMTTQEYRRSYNYRSEYFKRNPGFFGCIWFCSQCYKPLFGKKNVVVDHIRPLNKGGRNHVSNCTAICEKCNRAKSDIVDGRVLKGRIFKVFESSASRANRGVGAVAGLGIGLGMGAAAAGGRAVAGTAKAGGRVLKGTARFGFGTIFRLLRGVATAVFFPIAKGGFVSRLCFLGIYTLLVMYFLQTKTPVLNAWL